MPPDGVFCHEEEGEAVVGYIGEDVLLPGFSGTDSMLSAGPTGPIERKGGEAR